MQWLMVASSSVEEPHSQGFGRIPIQFITENLTFRRRKYRT